MKNASALTLPVLAALSFGCASGVQVPKDKITHPGQMVFNQHVNPEVNCFECHNGDARGAGAYPDLKPMVPLLPKGGIAAKIKEGGSWMPAFEGKITDEEVEQVVAWLRESFGYGEEAQEVEGVEEVPEEDVTAEPEPTPSDT